MVGSGIGGVTTLLSAYDDLLNKGPRAVGPRTVPMLMPNSPAAYVGLEFGARAGVHAPVSACATGAEAVGHAMEMIRSGRADVVLAGGTEAAIHPLPIAAFANMMAMSKRNDDPQRASRPFDVRPRRLRARRGRRHPGPGVGRARRRARRPGLRRGRRRRLLRRLPRHRPARARRPRRRRGAGLRAGGRRPVGRRRHAPERARHQHPARRPRRDHGLPQDPGLGRRGRRDLGHQVDAGHLLGGTGAIESVATVLALHHRQAPPTINIETWTPRSPWTSSATSRGRCPRARSRRSTTPSDSAGTTWSWPSRSV